jgi:hypothetical protein
MNNKIITKTKKCGCFSTKLQNKYHSINDVPSFKACEIHKIEEDKAILNWYKNGKYIGLQVNTIFDYTEMSVDDF